MTLPLVKLSSKSMTKVRRILSVSHRVTPCGPARASSVRAETGSSSPGGSKQSSKAAPWDAIACYAQENNFANISNCCRRSMIDVGDPNRPARGVVRAAAAIALGIASEPAKQQTSRADVDSMICANGPNCKHSEILSSIDGRWWRVCRTHNDSQGACLGGVYMIYSACWSNTSWGKQSSER